MAIGRPGNLRFTDKGLLDWHYRQSFLSHTEREAPEVLQSLKELIPKYSQVINAYPYTVEMADWLNGYVDLSGDPTIFDLQKRNILDNYLAVKDRYGNWDNELKKTIPVDSELLPELEETAWTNFLDLRDSFAAFIEQYGLTTDWLRQGLFRLLGNLSRSERNFNSLCYVYSHAYFPAQGEAIRLELEGWKMKDSWEEFETRARQKFDTMLSKHRAKTTNAWREAGYKQTTKPLDFTSVKWLVLWTVKRISKADILGLIRKERPSTMTEDHLNKDFRRLATFGLPYRH